MRSSAAAFCLLALVAVAGCHAAPSCKNAAPGTVCRGRVDNEPKNCVKPLDATSDLCPSGLLQLLGQVVTIASASPDQTCAMQPCCDVDGQTVECATLTVGCIIDVKLCVGGALGGLLNDLLDNLDIDLLTGSGNLPISIVGDGIIGGLAGK